MPPKTVRFRDENEAYSHPSTPSPTFSQATLSTQSGPVTPPSNHHSLSADPDKPLVAAYEPHGLHKIFSRSHTVPQLNFDLSFHPSDYPNYLYPALNPFIATPATASSEPLLKIKCELLPWTIYVKPASYGLSTCVTVPDVYLGLYDALRLAVTTDEIGAESPMRRKLIYDAFSRRVERKEDIEARNEEFRKGIKRIDFLTGKHCFLGLESAEAGGVYWLTVGECN